MEINIYAIESIPKQINCFVLLFKLLSNNQYNSEQKSSNYSN